MRHSSSPEGRRRTHLYTMRPPSSPNRTEPIRIVLVVLACLLASQVNMPYVFFLLGILAVAAAYILCSRRAITSGRIIVGLAILFVLILFECINLLIRPYLETVIGHSALSTQLVLAGIALLLIPVYSLTEKWVKKKFSAKNKKIRLAAARKRIEST